VDCTDDGLAPWDYLGGLLVCREAGAVVRGIEGDELVTDDHTTRRTVLAAATPGLAGELARARTGREVDPHRP
jgi:fructose-1,6-bisphosphatase/inositol monophosphatase family enzyme